MTETLEERRKKADKEYHELLKWIVDEEKKISRDLSNSDKTRGLDTNRETYTALREEFRRRLFALYDKYNLPNKPNW